MSTAPTPIPPPVEEADGRQWCIAVTRSEPEEGMAIYGPYPTEDAAKDDWPNVEPDFHNDNELPEDVVFEFQLMRPGYGGLSLYS